jgi:adenylate kinase
VNIILIGAQGSGKGTQAERLAQNLGIHHVSSGDLFRKVSEEETELGRTVRLYLDRGELVPDNVTVSMILQYMAETNYISQGVLLDGFPRTIAQAEALDKGLLSADQYVDCTIYLQVPLEVLHRRLSGRYICRAAQHVYNRETNPPKVPGICDLDGSELYQRPDDQGLAVQKRLNIFFEETIRLLDYYQKQGKLVEVNGNQPIEQVQGALLEAVRHFVAERS